MKPPVPFALWGAFMAVIFIVGLLFFGFRDVEPIPLFGGVVAVMVLLAALIAVRRWGVLDAGRLRAHPDVSPPMPWLGVSISLLAFSVEVGWWLSLIAGGMIAVGIGGLIRELRAEREALSEVAGE
jgi:hypothetical protein